MKKEHKQREKISVLIAILIVAITINLLYSYNLVHKIYFNDNIIKEIVTEGNITYEVTLHNYYDVEYSNTGDGLVLKIKNPCIYVLESSGLSMKPYWDDETLGIFDTCFPNENLKIGDVIVYMGELDSTFNPHHRIIDIDYEKEWVRTQGDNPETNSEPDDFVSFDRIMGKEIGVLNVLEDRKIVRKEVLRKTNEEDLEITFEIVEINQSCFCSSSGVVEVCHQNKTLLEMDTFLQGNDFREEYCK